MSGLGKMLARAGLLAAAGGAGFVLLSRGRIHVDLGWGRSTHELGPLIAAIAAPRDLVFEVIRAGYEEHAPAATRARIRVLERSGDLVVAEHRTPLPILDAITVETVRFQPPGHVEFRLLRGPVPAVWEEFVLDEAEDGTRLTYRGTLSADLWALGRIYGGMIVKPAWDRTVARSLDEVKEHSEVRARTGARRPKSVRRGHPSRRPPDTTRAT